ncbi:MAG TPA: Uma2 family endonuclease [Pyrinomonadaceae bacterium]|jgi:Uma2 family endonuclease|nr:Uma2 family endonuclease [Pyrinomonadaceae bacterium]
MNEKSTIRTNRTVNMEDYLSNERISANRNEFLGGRVIPKPSANRFHNRIVTNLAVAIGSRTTAGKLEMYVSNMLVKISGNVICYPDIVIVTGEPAFSDAELDVLLNPNIVIDVSSVKTDARDRTLRLENYMAMETIRECILVRSDEMRIEHFARQNSKQWMFRIYNERDDVISIDTISCKVSIQEIYAQVKFGRPAFSSAAVN